MSIPCVRVNHQDLVREDSWHLPESTVRHGLAPTMIPEAPLRGAASSLQVGGIWVLQCLPPSVSTLRHFQILQDGSGLRCGRQESPRHPR